MWKLSHIEKDLESYLSGSRKGRLDNLIEEQYFCYEANSFLKPDFSKVKVELKIISYEKNKNSTIKAEMVLVYKSRQENLNKRTNILRLENKILKKRLPYSQKNDS